MKAVSPFTLNIKFLEKHHAILARILSHQHPDLFQYEVTKAKNGQLTLAIDDGKKKLQVHSKYDPEKEALQQIRQKNYLNPRILIVFGFGLGYHIQAALQELKENMFIVVIERDPNVLMEAMRHKDLTGLFASEKIIWFFGLKPEEAYAHMFEFIKFSSMRFQLQLKTVVAFEHPILAQIHGEYFRQMLKQFREAVNHTILNYGNCPADSLMGVENIMKNLDVILKNPGVQDLYGTFRGVPGILVSTGPSLDKNIRDLVGVEGRCLMIAADSAVWPLLKAGVTPHAFATLERVIETVETYRTVPEEKMKEIFLAATPVIVPEGYAVWKGPTFITYRDFAHFKWLKIEKGTLSIGMSCSNMAFKLLEALGCDPIILVGQDCAFESLVRTHATGIEGELIAPLKQEQLYKVKGNYEEWVWTEAFFDLFRKGFVNDVAHFQGQVINCTAGGAFIEGTTLMPLSEAVQKYCQNPVNSFQRIQENLKYPTAKEVRRNWQHLHENLAATIREVRQVIQFCEKGVEKVQAFEDELATGGYLEIEDFLQRYPEEKIYALYVEFAKEREKLFNFGEAFKLYLMHIVQMILLRFEMDFNELPSLCADRKRCLLQSVRMMKQWYPTIRDVCKISLKLVEDSFETLKKEFGETS
jgi:hypothetical protein